MRDYVSCRSSCIVESVQEGGCHDTIYVEHFFPGMRTISRPTTDMMQTCVIMSAADQVVLLNLYKREAGWVYERAKLREEHLGQKIV